MRKPKRPVRKIHRTHRNRKIALIDGDGMVFQAVTNPDHRQEVHNEEDEYWEVLNAKQAKEEFAVRLKELLGVLNSREQDAKFAFGGKSYFRKKLDPQYKAKRAKKKPLGYWDFVKWVREEWDSISIPELEADDVLGVMHTYPEHWPENAETIVVSNDKDLRTIPGLLYNPDNTDPVERITEEQALRNLFIQSLTGDSGDGFGGAKGIGPVKAKKIADEALKEAKTIDDVFDSVIVPVYIEAGQTEGDALRNCRLARILSRVDVEIDEDGEWHYEIWEPVSNESETRRTSPRGSRRRKRRIPRRPVL